MLKYLPFLMLLACAHHKDVRPGVDGINRVVVQGDGTDQKAQQDAIDQSNHYCESIGKKAAFIDESTKYNGDMEEGSYKNAKRATKAVNSAGWVLGGTQGAQLGGIADNALGNAYTIEMKFKCM